MQCFHRVFTDRFVYLQIAFLLVIVMVRKIPKKIEFSQLSKELSLEVYAKVSTHPGDNHIRQTKLNYF